MLGLFKWQEKLGRITVFNGRRVVKTNVEQYQLASLRGLSLATNSRMKRLSTRDHIMRCHVGDCRVSVLRGTNALLEAIKRWNMPAKDAEIWGSLMAGSAMLASFFKGEERVKAILRTNLIKEAYTEAIHVGEVRGFLKRFSEDLGHTSIASQKGTLQVSKILYGKHKPFDSIVPIPESGSIEELWQDYFKMSEQVDTIVKLETNVNEGEIFCGGVIIQKMPPSSLEARADDIIQFNSLQPDDMPSLSRLLSHDTGLNYLKKLFSNADLSLEDCKVTPLDYFCRCSKQNFLRIIAHSKHSILENVQEVETFCCELCNTKYEITAKEIKDFQMK